MLRSVWSGIIMMENPNVMLLQIRYNNRLNNSVTSAECHPTSGRYPFNRAACNLFLTVLSQTLVPVAFLSKQRNFRLERNLLRRDKVVRKPSSCGVVLRGLSDLGRSAMFPVCWNLFISRLIVNSWRWKCRATSLADMPAVSIPMALSRCSNVIPGRRPITDFQRFFSSSCAYDKKVLELCTVWPAEDHPFCCAHTACDFHES